MRWGKRFHSRAAEAASNSTPQPLEQYPFLIALEVEPIPATPVAIAECECVNAHIINLSNTAFLSTSAFHFLLSPRQCGGRLIPPFVIILTEPGDLIFKRGINQEPGEPPPPTSHFSCFPAFQIPTLPFWTLCLGSQNNFKRWYEIAEYAPLVTTSHLKAKQKRRELPRGAFKKKTLLSTMSTPGVEGNGLRYLTLS